MNPNIDIQKFAQHLVKVGREYIFWEQKKLEWILEEEKKAARSEKAA